MRYLFRDHSISIRLFPSLSIVNDPFEKNTSEQELNPVTIQAIVTDLAFTKETWVMPGIIVDNSKQIIIQARDLSILLNSEKIQIKDQTTGVIEDYEGYKINGRLQYKREGEGKYQFVRCYIYRKTV